MDGLADDGSALEGVEFRATLHSLGKGDFDPNKIFRLPSGADDIVPTSVRLPVRILGAIDEKCGSNKKYRSKSKFIQHAIMQALDIDIRSDETYVPEPWVVLERIKDEMHSIRQSLDIAEDLLRNSQGSPQRSRAILETVRQLMLQCDLGGHSDLKQEVVSLVARYERFEDR